MTNKKRPLQIVETVGNRYIQLSKMVPVVGVEPTLQKEHDFESCASANSATPAL
jgi:hypothetical protein